MTDDQQDKTLAQLRLAMKLIKQKNVPGALYCLRHIVDTLDTPAKKEDHV